MQGQNLELAIDSIRVRFGSHALTRAAELPPPQPWRSETAIDGLSGIGGLPRGRLSLLTGNGTCGKLSLGLLLVANATHGFAHVIVIHGGGFDLSMLLPFSPELGALTVVGAPAPETAGESAATLARSGAGFLLLTTDVPEHWLGPLESAANRSGTIVVGVIDSPGRALAHASSFSVAFSRERWVFEREQLIGLHAVVRCVKNRVAAPMAEMMLDIRYPLGSRRLSDYEPRVSEKPFGVEELEPRKSFAV